MTKHGLLIIDKPSGMTSHTVVAKVKRITGAVKAGNTVTLDPNATGVMTVMLNSAVKASSFLTGQDKTYLAKLVLGIETNTYDTTGTVLKRYEGDLPGIEQIEAVLPEFRGNILQVPPMFSAIKIGGEKLYDLARKGEEVEREPRTVTIKTLEAEQREDGIYLYVHCSKGTYIRSLCADIGTKLGCGGVMDSLVRMSVGGFSLDAAITIDTLTKMSKEEIDNIIIPTESLFSSVKKIDLPEFYERLAKNGAEVYLHKLGCENDFHIGDWVRMYCVDGFFAIGRVKNYPNGIAIKSETMFL